MSFSTQAEQSSLLVAFAEQTTAHGVVRLTHGSYFRRLFWLCIIVGATCGFGIHLHQLVTKYSAHSVTSSFSDELVLQFPWVTICPTDYIARIGRPNEIISGVINGQRVTKMPHMIISNMARLYYRLLDNRDWNTSVVEEALNRFEEGKLVLRSHFFETTNNVRMPHEFIINCFFNGQECSYRNFTFYKDEKYFSCATFSPTNRSLAQAGENGGLFLVLYHAGFAIYNAQEQLENSAGLRVALHEPGFKPDLSTAHSAPLAYKTSLDFSVTHEKTIDRKESSCSESLSNVTYTSDYSRPGDHENVTFFGSMQDCVLRVKQMEFVRECGCLGDHLALPADLMQLWPVCHKLPDLTHLRNLVVTLRPGGVLDYDITNDSLKLQPLKTFVSSWQAQFDRVTTFAKCYDAVRSRQSKKDMSGYHSGCRKPCKRIKIAVTRTSDIWPPQAADIKPVRGAIIQSLHALDAMAIADGLSNFAILDTIRRVKRELKSYYAILKVFSMSTRATLAKEDYAYTLKDVFSDLGGILGLWVGVSVITLMELVELAVQLFTRCAFRMNNLKNDVHPVDQTKADHGTAEKEEGHTGSENIEELQ